MAFDPKPSTWLGAGYTVDAGAHTITFTTNDAGGTKALPLLTDALANPTTGDIRAVMFAIVEAFNAAWAAQGAGNTPLEMTLTRTAFERTVSGTDQLIRTYSQQLVLLPTGFVIADEP